MKLELDKDTGLPYQVHDLNMRLSGCLVMHDGKPFYIIGVEGKDLRGIYTLEGEGFTVTLPDPRLDISAKPVGYVNNNKSCYYFCRQPVRRYKQGLHKQNIFCAEPVPVCLDHSIFGRMLMGEYPSFEDCMNHVKLKRGSRAFSRKWAVANRDGLELEHRGETVGWFSFGAPVLSSAFEYLKEDLEEAIARSRQ